MKVAEKRLNKKGTIFDLREFTVHDGPGIRQTVFFKGCPLRCNWCHNPEGLSIQPQLMVAAGSCTDCGACREFCHKDPCTDCGACAPVCPHGLRRMVGEELTSQELVHRIGENSDYYARYGGGVTFSGGEPLMQAAFLLEVLQAIPGLHRAIETSGYTDPDTFAQVVRHLDYVMIDIKAFDSAVHKRHTGVDNAQILANVRQLCEGDTPFAVRIPVIPGVNDNRENYENIAAWIAGAKALDKVELLPYHQTAGVKYKMIGESYAPLFDPGAAVYIDTTPFTHHGIRSEVL